VIDLHSHILPGLDDGAASIAESVEIARRAASNGIEAIAATPHVRDDYPTTPDAMERALADVRAAIDEAGVLIRILPGAEVALTRLDALSADEFQRFGLGGNPDYVLVETPYRGWPLDLEERLFRLRIAGITAVLAHPERNVDVQDDPERLVSLVSSGTIVQVTAGSLTGDCGARAQATGRRLIERGLAHLVATDTHGSGVPRAGLEAVADAIADRMLARWLTDDVPSAIVEGLPRPDRPVAQRRRRFYPFSQRL
jgi:protein-tyrosine phosphatase